MLMAILATSFSSPQGKRRLSATLLTLSREPLSPSPIE
jgi:hypothetical protein